MTIGNAGKLIASINNLVIDLIHHANFQNAAHAKTWFGAHVPHVFALLTTPFHYLGIKRFQFNGKPIIIAAVFNN